MAFNRDKADAPYRKRNNFHRKKKVCVFCGKDNTIDYKDTAKLRKYVSPRAARSFPEGLPAHARLIRER